MEKRVKIVYILAFIWAAVFIAFLLIFTSFNSQKILPAPGEVIYQPSSGNFEIILIVIITLLSIVLICFAFSHFFWRNREKEEEWTPTIKEENKKYSSIRSRINIVKRKRNY